MDFSEIKVYFWGHGESDDFSGNSTKCDSTRKIVSVFSYSNSSLPSQCLSSF